MQENGLFSGQRVQILHNRRSRRSSQISSLKLRDFWRDYAISTSKCWANSFSLCYMGDYMHCGFFCKLLSHWTRFAMEVVCFVSQPLISIFSNSNKSNWLFNSGETPFIKQNKASPKQTLEIQQKSSNIKYKMDISTYWVISKLANWTKTKHRKNSMAKKFVTSVLWPILLACWRKCYLTPFQWILWIQMWKAHSTTACLQQHNICQNYKDTTQHQPSEISC